MGARTLPAAAAPAAPADPAAAFPADPAGGHPGAGAGALPAAAIFPAEQATEPAEEVSAVHSQEGRSGADSSRAGTFSHRHLPAGGGDGGGAGGCGGHWQEQMTLELPFLF